MAEQVVEVSARISVLPGAVNIGFLRGAHGDIALIDTGLDASSGKRALKAAASLGWGNVRHIVTTHAHADHFGGNAVVVKRTGATVMVPPIDDAILRYPQLHPAMMYGGCDPVEALNVRFLVAPTSPVDELLHPGRFEIAGVLAEIVPLPGHSPNQIGIVVDGVFCSADVTLPDRILDKYRLPYLYSVTDHLHSLAHARTIECEFVVPGHGPVMNRSEFLALLTGNEQRVNNVIGIILDALATPMTAEAILTTVLRTLGADPTDPPSYYLIQPTIGAFLSHLEREHRIHVTIENQMALWAICRS